MAKINPSAPKDAEAGLKPTRPSAKRAVSLSALKEQAEGLRRAQLMANLAHVVTRPDGSFESWSETLPGLLGIKDEEVVTSTRRWLDLIHPADREAFRATALGARTQGARADVEYRILRADGKWIYLRQVIEPIPGPVDEQGQTRWFNTIQDITAAKMAERCGRMSRPLQRDALRMIQDIIGDATGTPLPPEARQRLEAVLAALSTGELPHTVGSEFSAREVTILFADLRGFSAIAAAYPAPAVISLLNRCFGTMVDITARHFGTVDKFIGDAIMVIFGGDPAAPRDHARRAVLCAVEMQIAMNELRERQREEGVPDLYMGIGINTGKVMAGLIGSEAYRAYTLIGEEVNIASRIEALSLRGQVLMSESTYMLCRDFVEAGEPTEVHVKGKADRVRVREALGVPALGKVMPRQDVRKSPRVAVRLDIDYWVLEGKVVTAARLRAVIRDLGYNGALVELERSLPVYSELKLAFDLPALGYRAEEIYARIVSTREQEGRMLAGIEFTSIAADASAKVRLSVQMLLQGEYHETE